MHVKRIFQRAARCGWWLWAGGILSATATASEPGRVAWADLLTSGVPAEEASFYSKVFGWEIERTGTVEAPYVVLVKDGRPVAGVAYRAEEVAGPARNRWLGFFAVAEPAAVAARAEAAGAVVLMPARRWPGRGEQVVLADGEGATFGLLEQTAAKDYPWSWAVLLTTEPKTGADFYAGMLGVAAVDDVRTPMFTGDFVLTDGGRVIAGVTASPMQAGGRAGWLWFLHVAKIDEAVRAVERHGGRVLRKPGIDLMGGRLAVVADPRGAVFGLVEPTAAKAGAAKLSNSEK